jgi:hypothetical protein
MTTPPPIDILAIASARLSEAQTWQRATMAMQAGPAAAFQGELARYRMREAFEDVQAAQHVAAAIGREENAP